LEIARLKFEKILKNIDIDLKKNGNYENYKSYCV